MSLTGRIASLARRDSMAAIGVALSAVWLLLLALFWLLAPGDEGAIGGIARLVAVVGAVMPLALIWMAVGLARAIAVLRAEADELRLRMTQLRDGMSARSVGPSEGGGQRDSKPVALLSDPAAPGTPQSGSTEPPVPALRNRAASDLRQTAMRFDAPEPVEISPETMIRAMNFPDGPDDAEAVAALRAALKDHDSARVLRAAQDVIMLLAGHGIYMDDLAPDPAPAAVWRRFADGARGSAVAALGGIHDEYGLDATAALLRTDEIFRDAAHHFLRHFDTRISRLLGQLDDTQIMVLAETRSARAFMLVGRAAGIFG